MKVILLTLASALLLTSFGSYANEVKTPDIIDSIKPFESCEPASIYAQQALEKATQLIDYQGEEITLCRSLSIPTIAAWSKLLRMEKHPYVNWKKRPITAPHISYNPHYFEQLQTAQGDTIIYAVLAQQVGHHIKDHTNFKTPLAGLSPEPEKTAATDYYAGALFAQLKLSQAQLIQAQQALFSLTNPPTPAVLKQRQEQLLDGWVKGGGEPIELPDISPQQRW
ncbi:MAG: hypothetical protein L3J62_11170 [Gammaproteobacteria bacterium]|nr:hypothetical protein [Gammaproteobacteria bacterium]MCF6231321.1 hypothetical protein [Gammaproteobacteria bacterium]